MEYEEIKKIKKMKFFEDDFNYMSPMAIKLWQNKYIHLFKIVCFCLFFKPIVFYINNNSDILISYPFKKGKRKDYDEIINNLKKITKNYNEIFFSYKWSLVLPIKRLIKFIKNYKVIKLGDDYRKIDKIKVNLLLLIVQEVKTEIENIIFKEKVLISFCDACLEENILAQILKKKSMKTVTLQHGQYRFLNNYKDENVEAYENFISDYILVWGEKTKIEFMKAGIAEKRILIAGSLKDTIKNSTVCKKNVDMFCVILDGETYIKSNIEMIRIANKLSKKINKKYYIRFHPMNKKSRYLKEVCKENYCCNLEEVQPIFSILHMTGVILEKLLNNEEFYIFNDKYQEEIFKIEKIMFLNEEDLFFKYKNKLKIDSLEVYKLFNAVNNYEELKIKYLDILEKIGDMKI